jgi:hypothetical protein
MIDLSEETETLAKRLADAQHLSVETAVRQALEEKVSALEWEVRPRRRQTVDEMLAVAREIAAMPILDAGSPNEIMDDLDSL